jgi:hypothetical protein
LDVGEKSFGQEMSEFKTCMNFLEKVIDGMRAIQQGKGREFSTTLQMKISLKPFF